MVQTRVREDSGAARRCDGSKFGAGGRPWSPLDSGRPHCSLLRRSSTRRPASTPYRVSSRSHLHCHHPSPPSFPLSPSLNSPIPPPLLHTLTMSNHVSADRDLCAPTSTYKHVLLLTTAHPPPSSFTAFYTIFLTNLRNRLRAAGLMQAVHLYAFSQIHVTVASLQRRLRDERAKPIIVNSPPPSMRPPSPVSAPIPISSIIRSNSPNIAPHNIRANNNAPYDPRPNSAGALPHSNDIANLATAWHAALSSAVAAAATVPGSPRKHPALQSHTLRLHGAHVFEDGVGVLLWTDTPSATVTTWRNRVDAISQGDNDDDYAEPALGKVQGLGSQVSIPDIIHSSIMRWRAKPNVDVQTLREIFDAAFESAFAVVGRNVHVDVGQLHIVEECGPCMTIARHHYSIDTSRTMYPR